MGPDAGAHGLRAFGDALVEGCVIHTSQRRMVRMTHPTKKTGPTSTCTPRAPARRSGMVKTLREAFPHLLRHQALPVRKYGAIPSSLGGKSRRVRQAPAHTETRFFDRLAVAKWTFPWFGQSRPFSEFKPAFLACGWNSKQAHTGLVGYPPDMFKMVQNLFFRNPQSSRDLLGGQCLLCKNGHYLVPEGVMPF